MNTAHVKLLARIDTHLVDTITGAAHYMTSGEQEIINRIRNPYDMEVIKITAQALKRKQLHEQVRNLPDDALVEIMGADRGELEAMPGDNILRMMDGE